LKRKLPYYFLLFALVAVKVGAQTSENQRPAVGGFGDLNLNMAHANFPQLPGVPDCNSLYRSGTGFGPAFGIFYEVPIQNKFSFLLRGVYDLYGEKLTSNELTPLAINGVETTGTIEHSIQATLGMIGFQPMGSYHITPAFSIHLGGEIGFVIQSSFNQIETLTEPATSGVFDNGLRTRNAQYGKIPNANPIVASLIGGISYALPLNRSNTIQAVPELSYSYALTPVVKNYSWSVTSIRAGIAIRYELPEKAVESPKPIPVDTTPVSIPVAPPVAMISASGLNSEGVEAPVAVLHVEEIYSTRMTPLLPYIFFEKNEYAIPLRYNKVSPESIYNFTEIGLKDQDALSINHKTLDIIGKRMSADSDAVITLAGITLNNSRFFINKKLAFSRAEEIANYLKSTWHISDDRIRITTHPLAEETVAALDSDGVAEANRVEIACNSFGVLQPVMGSDTIRNATPPVIRFHLSVKYSDTLSLWNLSASQDGILLKSFEGKELLPVSLDWILGNDQKSIPHFPGKIDYELKVTGSHSDEAIAAGSLPVEQLTLRKKKVQRIADREIEKYNLLLFDLQSSELNETNKQIIELIQKHLKDISAITIIGHTDRTGEAEANKQLSFDRAKSTARALGVTKADIRGIANETVLYDNNLPEGRCLSRTVDIIVETPADVQ